MAKSEIQSDAAYGVDEVQTLVADLTAALKRCGEVTYLASIASYAMFDAGTVVFDQAVGAADLVGTECSGSIDRQEVVAVGEDEGFELSAALELIEDVGKALVETCGVQRVEDFAQLGIAGDRVGAIHSLDESVGGEVLSRFWFGARPILHQSTRHASKTKRSKHEVFALAGNCCFLAVVYLSAGSSQTTAVHCNPLANRTEKTHRTVSPAIVVLGKQLTSGQPRGDVDDQQVAVLNHRLGRYSTARLGVHP